MSEAKHTPGPWKMTSGEIGYEIDSEGSLWKAVADCKPNNFGTADVGDDEAKANARLVAAAPDLLHALHLMISAFGPTHPPMTAASHAAEKALAAIRKATGEK